jgi:hypothetical protein
VNQALLAALSHQALFNTYVVGHPLAHGGDQGGEEGCVEVKVQSAIKGVPPATLSSAGRLVIRHFLANPAPPKTPALQLFQLKPVSMQADAATQESLAGCEKTSPA